MNQTISYWRKRALDLRWRLMPERCDAYLLLFFMQGFSCNHDSEFRELRVDGCLPKMQHRQ